MKRKAPFDMLRSLSILGAVFGLPVCLALIIWLCLPASFHAVAWGALAGALVVILVALAVMIARRGSGRSDARDTMEPHRVEALVSLFKRLENRTQGKGGAKGGHLAEQTEEAYQKEQAEWLASVKRKKGEKKRKPGEER